MLFTSHVATGAMLGTALDRPLAAAAVGVASHVGMDMLPHWGGVPIHSVLHIARTDGFTGLAVSAAALALARRRLPVLAGMVGAALLDLDKPSVHFFGTSPFPRAVDDFHVRIQNEAPHRLVREWALAGALAAAALLVVGR